MLGHGPHILQGIELYRGKFIFYSLGNFIFEEYPDWFDTKQNNTMLVSAMVSGGTVSSVDVHPMYRKDGVRPFRVSREDRAFGLIADSLKRNSRQFGTRFHAKEDMITVDI